MSDPAPIVPLNMRVPSGEVLADVPHGDATVQYIPSS